MSSVFDIYADFELKKTWIILYLLNTIEKNKGVKSKYIAKIINRTQRQVIGVLIKLDKMGLVDKQQTLESLCGEGYTTHLWFISQKGKDLIESRIALDTQSHFCTLQKLNEITERVQ